jgi:hypothetical protein
MPPRRGAAEKFHALARVTNRARCSGHVSRNADGAMPPSSDHEMILGLLRRSPEALLALLRKSGVRLPERPAIEEISSSFGATALEFRADLLRRHGFTFSSSSTK